MNRTARDMQDTLLRWLGADNNAESTIDAREAINDALKELWGRHDWPWYTGQHTFKVDAPYETGTVTFSLATLRMTLTGGTWPSWVEYGTIKIESAYARVTKQISSTVIEIEDGTQFTEDLTDQTYTLSRNEYPLPDTIRKVSYMTNDTNSQHITQYVTPMEFSTRRPGVYGTVPLIFTIQKDRKAGNGLSLLIWPYPTTAWSYRFSYIRSPSNVTVWSYTEGKLTTAAGLKTITGKDTVFDPVHEGCLLRVGRDGTNVPTSQIGLYPFSEECVVDNVLDGVSMDVASNAAYTRERVKYEISSLIDTDEVIMSSVFLLECYLALGKRRNKDMKEMQTLSQSYEMTLRNAIAKSKTASQITYAGQGRQSAYSQWYNLGVL